MRAFTRQELIRAGRSITLMNRVFRAVALHRKYKTDKSRKHRTLAVNSTLQSFIQEIARIDEKLMEIGIDINVSPRHKKETEQVKAAVVRKRQQELIDTIRREA